MYQGLRVNVRVTRVDGKCNGDEVGCDASDRDGGTKNEKIKK